MQKQTVILSAALLGALSAPAQSSTPSEQAPVEMPPLVVKPAPAVQVEAPPAEDLLNQFGVNFQMGFNLEVNFKNVGSFSPMGHAVPGNGVQPANPGSASGATENRTYEDGYNWADSTGNSHPGFPNTTTFWEYDNAGQAPGNGTVVMHSTSSAGVSSSHDDDPTTGFEIFYRRQVARNDSWDWGIEAAAGYQSLSVKDAGSLGGLATSINDAFPIPVGVADPPKQPGVDGEFSPAGPAPVVLGTVPDRTLTTGSTTITGSREFDADIFGMRLGPYVEVSLGKQVALIFSGGLSLAHVASDLNVSQETVLFQGVTHTNPGGSGSHDDWVAGGFLAGNLLYRVSESWGLFCGVQFQSAGTYEHTVAGKRAELDLGSAVYLSFGATFSF